MGIFDEMEKLVFIGYPGKARILYLRGRGRKKAEGVNPKQKCRILTKVTSAIGLSQKGRPRNFRTASVKSTAAKTFSIFMLRLFL